MIFFLLEFFDLVGECDIGEEEATVLLIVVVFVLGLVSRVRENIHLEFVLKVEVHENKKSLKFILIWMAMLLKSDLI